MSLFEELFQNHIIKILKHVEKLEMADFTALESKIAALGTKIDAYIAAHSAPPPPVDEQPAVDTAAAAVDALAAKLP